MILELLIGLIWALMVFIIFAIIINFSNQHKVNQYFKKISPNLPVPYELISIYGGHAKTIVYNARNCFIVEKLHSKYGKTFGIYYAKKPAVSTMDVDLIKQMILDDPINNEVNRAKVNLPIEEIDIDTIATAEKKQWKRLRLAAAPAFTNHKIKSSPNVLSEVEKTISKFVDAIEKRIDDDDDDGRNESATFNLDDIFHRYTLDLVFRCFYKQKELINFNLSKPDYWVELMSNGFKSAVNPVLVMCLIFPIFAPILDFLLNNFHPQGKMRLDIKNFIKLQTITNFQAKKEIENAKLLAEKNEIKFDPDNFVFKNGQKFSRLLIDHFTDQFFDGRLTKSEYFNSSAFIFYASNKTSADALSLLIYHLALNENVQKKLRDSIEKDGIESKYLTWTIKESMRLYPPAPLGCSRVIEADYKTKDGILIPKGTIVLTSVYSIHRSKELWGDDVLEFNPDRWANSKDFHPCQYLTFGLGRRNCLGKYFAVHEMKMLMNVLVRKFKFERSNKTSDNNYFQSPCFIFTVFDEPHYIKITKL